MKAQIIRDFGGPEVFEAAERPEPQAGPGEVTVRIAAASVNPVDYKLRQAGPEIAPKLPAVLGCDMAGWVTAVGSEVSQFREGDAVYGCVGGVRGMHGTYAEEMAADARLIAPKPKSLTMRQAAALPLAGITAYEGLYDRAGLVAGETVLIHGGTGGVGHLAVQLAKARGAFVATTVSSSAKAEIAQRLGADATINYREEEVDSYVARLTSGRGFDVVFDATGGSDLPRSFQAARLNGRVVTIVAQYECDLSLMHAKGLSLHMVFMLVPMLHDIGRDHHGEILREIAELVDDGRLVALLDETAFTLADVAEAHRRLEAGTAVGKIVLTVSDGAEAAG